MGFVSRISDFVGRAFTPNAKSYAVPAASGYGGWMGGFGGMGGGGVREPFAGAWQQGVKDANSGPYAFANSAIYTCVNVISSDMANLPVQIMRPNDVTGVPEPHTNHPAWALFQNPNSFQTSLQFIQQYMTSKLGHGNTYVFLLRDARNVVNEMYVLDPYCVQPLVADDGSIFYRLNRNQLAGITDSIVIPARDVLHDRCMVLPQFHPLVGVSPLFAAYMSQAMAGRIQVNTEHFFGNMSIPSGYLTAVGKIEPAVSKKLQSEWETNYSGRGLGRTAVLSNGLDYKALTGKFADAEMVALLRWTVEDIARCFRVPQYMVGEMSKATYRNSEQMSRDYFSKCLAHYINAFEKCFNKALGLPLGTEVKFDLSDLFRMEADIRYANYQIGLQGGFLTINEVRAMEDLQPVANGDEPRVQMQWVPLSIADKLALANAEPKTAPSPAPAPKAIEEPPIAKQLEFLLEDPVQLDLLTETFSEHFDLGDNNGA